MWFNSQEEIERKEELEKMAEKAIFENTVKAELESPGSTRIPFFTGPEKERVLREAIKTADGIRERTIKSTSGGVGGDGYDSDSSRETDADERRAHGAVDTGVDDIMMGIGVIVGAALASIFMLMYIVASVIKLFNQELSEVSFTDKMFWLPTAGVGTAIVMGIFAKLKSARRKKREKKEQEEKEWKTKDEAKRKRRIQEQIESRQVFEEEKQKAMERLASEGATQAIADGFKLGCVLHRYWDDKNIDGEIDRDDRYEIECIIKKYASLKDVAKSVSYLTPYGVFKKIRAIAEKEQHSEVKDFEEGMSYGIRYGK